MRRIAYTILALFRSVTQRSDVRREVPWKALISDVFFALINGDYYIAYHRFAIPNGDGTHREVCLDKLEFNADGTILPAKTSL